MPFDPGNPELLTPDPSAPRRLSYEDLASTVIRYAQHEWSCKATDDPHCPHSMTDERVACADYPCTCGLGAVLRALMPTITYHTTD